MRIVKNLKVGVEGLLGLAIVATLGLVLIVFISLTVYYPNQLRSMDQLTNLVKTKNQFIHYNSMLTFFTRMSSYTGDQKWKGKYESYEKKLDQAVFFVQSNAPKELMLSTLYDSNEVNQQLILKEKLSFKYAETGELQKAQKILNSDEYLNLKKQYDFSMVKIEDEIQNLIKNRRDSLESYKHKLYGLIIGLFLVISSIWYFVYFKIKNLRKVADYARRQIQEKTHQMALLGQISGGVAHDIINPLTVIGMASDRLLAISTDDKQKKLITDINKSYKMALNVVKSLSSLSRKESSRDIGEYYFRDLLEQVFFFSNKKLQEAGIENMSTEFPPELKIKCNDTIITQVLINLIHNSVDAISNNDEKWIKITAKIEQGKSFISVIDSGKGISSELQKKIFELQYTTKERGKGTGLGLGISRQLLLKMNSELIYDQDSANTKFTIIIHP